MHFLDGKPRYVGEGHLGREKDFGRRRNYTPHGRWLNKHRYEHICVLITSYHHDRVGALLQEQGLINWLGRKIAGTGPLLNFLPYGTTRDHEHCTPEVKKKLSEATKGVPKTELHRKRLKDAAQRREKIKCPHCGKIGDPGPMKRWHFKNCKLQA